MNKYFIISNLDLLNSYQKGSLKEEIHIRKILINNIDIHQINAQYVYLDKINLLKTVHQYKNMYQNITFFIHKNKIKKQLLENKKNILTLNRILANIKYVDLTEFDTDYITQIALYFRDENNFYYIFDDKFKENNFLKITSDSLHFNIKPYTLVPPYNKNIDGVVRLIDSHFPKKKKLSICFILHNRTLVDIGNNNIRPIFPNCLQSVKTAIDNLFINDLIVEINIIDFQSTDKPIDQWIHSFLGGYNYKIKKSKYIESPFDDGKFFDRGLARNIIGDSCNSDYILWLDTDMIITEELIYEGIKTVDDNVAFFPVCFYCLTSDNKYGFFANGGYGNCMLSREMFNKCKWPQWPEHKSYFAEDSSFFKKIKKQYNVKEKNINKYFHQYHPGKMVNKVKLRDPRPFAEFPYFLDINKKVDNNTFQIRETNKMTIALLCPSRERIERKTQLIQSLINTTSDLNNIILYFGIDSDDPTKDQAYQLQQQHNFIKIVELHNDKFPGLSKLWNDVAKHTSENILSMIGDDMIFTTKNWDIEILKEFDDDHLPKDKIKMVHCFDGLGQHQDRVAVNFFYHRKYYEIVGKFIPQGFIHYYVDTWVTEVFRRLNRKTYRSDITIEHRHHSHTGIIDDVTNKLENARKNSNDEQLWKERQQDLTNEVNNLQNYINVYSDKTLMICNPGRIGDIIITLPIAKYYYEKGNKIVWPIYNDYINFFAPYINYVTFVPIDRNVYNFKQYCEQIKQKLGVNKLVELCITWPFYEHITHPWNNNNMKFDQYKYQLADVPFDQKWNLSIKENINKQEQLYQKLITNEKYIVVHEDGSDYHLDLNINKSGHQVVKITPQDGYGIFDWIKILKNAQELHLVDSCFANLVEQLNLKNKKYFYKRSPDKITPTLKNKWEIRNG